MSNPGEPRVRQSRPTFQWVQVLAENASESNVVYWQRWFSSKAIETQIRTAKNGPALYRQMPSDEYRAFLRMTDRDQRESRKAAQ